MWLKFKLKPIPFQFVHHQMDYLVTSRPTGVNLRREADSIKGNHWSKKSLFKNTWVKFTILVLRICYIPAQWFRWWKIHVRGNHNSLWKIFRGWSRIQQGNGRFWSYRHLEKMCYLILLLTKIFVGTIVQCMAGSPDEEVSVLTHCNTGSLATAGYGTALGVIRSLHSKGKLKMAYFTETR